MTRSPIPARAGIGLRFQHHQAFLDSAPDVAWLEVHTENYMGGGAAIATLERIRQRYPISLHGVGLSLGSAGELDRAHLTRIWEVKKRIEPGLISEHLSWSAGPSAHLPDLLPLPLTEEALDVMCAHVDEAQDFLGHQLLVENPSTYIQFAHSTIPEWEFLRTLVARTGCGLLCDVNNIYVSCCNHGWDAITYLDGLPADAVAEIHLAGHSIRYFEGRSLRVDDHGSAVSEDVWCLLEEALSRFGPVPVLIEWDNDIPSLDMVLSQARSASKFLERRGVPLNA